MKFLMLLIDLLQVTVVIWKNSKVAKGSVALYLFLQGYNLCFILEAGAFNVLFSILWKVSKQVE